MTRLMRPQQRNRPETIVALVDVVFFLLVFALLIGRMDATAPFQIDPPRAVSGTDLPGGGVTVTLSADADLALDGSGIEEGDLIDALRLGLLRDPDLRVRFNADGALALRHLLPLIEDVSRIGARDVVLVVTPEG